MGVGTSSLSCSNCLRVSPPRPAAAAGPQRIYAACGTDATDAFNQAHGREREQQQQMDCCYVGALAA